MAKKKHKGHTVRFVVNTSQTSHSRGKVMPKHLYGKLFADKG
ncbi:hypothetical protein KUA50_007540 [Segatella hominis]|nr:hypothetical protein [Segatella hominis]WOZ82765.1 hypothetical protein KUA50_007540 [Segatella hominis]